MQIPFCNLTTQDLANVISQDAVDTLDKLLSAYQPLTVLASAYIDDDFLSTDEEDEIYQAFSQLPNNAITIVDEDGDLIHIRATVESNPVETPNDLTIWRSVNGVDWEVIYTDHQFVSDPVFYDASGQAHSMESLVSSLANQLQASEVMKRLADLCSSGDVGLSTVVAALSDIAPNMCPSVGSLYSAICANGSSLNAASLANILRQVYTQGFTNATPDDNDEKIIFASDTYTMSAFYGTVIKGIVNTAAQALLTIIGTVGNGVGWIISSVGSLILSGVNATIENFDRETKATFNYDPTAYAFVKPLWQGTISKSYVSDDINQAISLYGSVIVKYPFFDIFAWPAGTDSVHLEFYGNLLITGNLKSIQALNASRYMFTYDEDGSSNLNLYCSIDKKISGSSDPSYFPYTEIAQYDTPNGQPQLYSYVPIPADATDDYLRRRVWVSLATTIWWFLNVKAITNSWTQTAFKGMKFATGPNSGGPSWTGEFAILANHIFNWVNADVVPSWYELVDTIIPVMRSVFFETFTPTDWAVIFDRSSVYQLSSATYWTRQAGSYRHSFAVIPPKYTEDALINAVLATAALTAAAAAITVGAVRAKRSITKRITKMQTQAQELFSAYTDPQSDHYHDETYLNAYLKKARATNFVAGLTGRSAVLPATIGSTNSATGASTTSSVTDLVKGLTDTITGDGDNGGVSPTTLESLAKLISG